MIGEPLSSGISLGKAHLLAGPVVIENCSITKDQIESEISRFREGRDKAAAVLEKLIVKVQKDMGESQAEIFEGHLEILSSEDVEEEVLELISEKLVCAEKAVLDFAESNAKEMESLESEYFQERGQDFRDIGRQIVAGIQGEAVGDESLPDEAVVVADELTPSQTAQLDMTRVKGFIIRIGGRNSHVAIMARSMEIPAVILNEAGLFQVIRSGDELYLNGDSGEVEINPPPAKVVQIKGKIKEQERKKQDLMKLLALPSVTLDGHKVKLYSNVGGSFDLTSSTEYKADGIGLFRSEFLFMESMSLPGVERQTEAYRKAVETMEGKEVIIRLLDTGADKPLPYWQLPEEENPFLGIRGIRLLLQKEGVLRTQIQALIQASSSGPVGIMIPMVGSLGPIEKVKSIVEEERKALGLADSGNLKVGVMIETPAAVMLIEEILEIVDFISIGTNDLTQYTLAVDRGNPSMNDYYDEFHPAVFRSIARVITASKSAGKMSGVCGELAGNKLALPFLLGLGVDELSMTPSRILETKKVVRGIRYQEAKTLVEQLMRISTPEGIKTRLSQFLNERDLLK
ncbi:MAG: phosphoenolpyruvate--protein phosphotransferase [Spirochaetales bacterium]|nr:phosphoenolpyruvate--protein phosphotransferase [Spirochaetales bacterium]